MLNLVWQRACDRRLVVDRGHLRVFHQGVWGAITTAFRVDFDLEDPMFLKENHGKSTSQKWNQLLVVLRILTQPIGTFCSFEFYMLGTCHGFPLGPSFVDPTDMSSRWCSFRNLSLGHDVNCQYWSLSDLHLNECHEWRFRNLRVICHRGHRNSCWCHFLFVPLHIALGNLLRSLEVWESQVVRTKTILVSDERIKHKNIGKRGQAMLRQAVLPRGFQNLRRRRARVWLTQCHVHAGDARVKVELSHLPVFWSWSLGRLNLLLSALSNFQYHIVSHFHPDFQVMLQF